MFGMYGDDYYGDSHLRNPDGSIKGREHDGWPKTSKKDEKKLRSWLKTSSEDYKKWAEEQDKKFKKSHPEFEKQKKLKNRSKDME